MMILDQQIPLRGNLKASFKRYAVLWWLLVFSQLLDSYSTVLFMQLDGISHEANFIIRWLANNLGLVTGVVLGKSFQFVVAVVFSALSLKYSRAILILLTGLNGLAAIHNFSYL
ncbi:MAG TPA: hypothetical protein ENJ41_02075 [Oceanospirillales bacterium]|nr:hypothetical protein [Oceanospirillales bacterium]